QVRQPELLRDLAPQDWIKALVGVAAPPPSVVGADVKHLAEAVLLLRDYRHLAKARAFRGIGILQQHLRRGLGASHARDPIDLRKTFPDGPVLVVFRRQFHHRASAALWREFERARALGTELGKRVAQLDGQHLFQLRAAIRAGAVARARNEKT